MRSTVDDLVRIPANHLSRMAVAETLFVGSLYRPGRSTGFASAETFPNSTVCGSISPGLVFVASTCAHLSRGKAPPLRGVNDSRYCTQQRQGHDTCMKTTAPSTTYPIRPSISHSKLYRKPNKESLHKDTQQWPLCNRMCTFGGSAPEDTFGGVTECDYIIERAPARKLKGRGVSKQQHKVHAHDDRTLAKLPESRSGTDPWRERFSRNGNIDVDVIPTAAVSAESPRVQPHKTKRY